MLNQVRIWEYNNNDKNLLFKKSFDPTNRLNGEENMKLFVIRYKEQIPKFINWTANKYFELRQRWFDFSHATDLTINSYFVVLLCFMIANKIPYVEFFSD